jgi:hypothetical protein
VEPVFEGFETCDLDTSGSLTGGSIDCGHYVPEHAPEETLDWFVRFFSD